MKISSTGMNLIKKYEGLNLNVYADPSGYPTVGYGYLLTRARKYTPNKNLSQADANKELKSAGLSYTSPITQSQAEALLKKELTNTVVPAINNLENGKRLTQNQFDSLASFAYNAGIGIFQTSDMKSLLVCPETYADFIGPINLPVMKKKVHDAFQYTLSDGKKLPGLVKRRNAEAELFCKDMRYTFDPID
jgi:lysozyme